MSGQVRIIGGQWRGRKLPVSDTPGLRPTPDRVRETVFNWLAPCLPASRCLDLFAGSGALGIEAASRGAQSVLLVEKNAKTVACLNQQIKLFSAQHFIEVICAEALRFLKSTNTVFDVVFLDPPFGQDLLTPCCHLLEQGNWLNSPAYIYLEAEQALETPLVPDSWQIIRQKRAGDVRFFLALRH